MKRFTLKYWQKTYLATLGLFLCCLAGSIGAVITQIICIIVSILIYIPFVKLLNRQQEA